MTSSSSSRGGWVVGLVFALAAAFVPSGARAAESSEDALLRQGVERRRQHDDTAALEFFRQAYEIKQSPRAAAQMGLAEMAVGRWVEAEAHLDEAVAAATDPWIVKNTATLRKSLASTRQRLGSLKVLGGPDGAEITIEAKAAGKLPLAKPIRVRAGECRFEVSAPGHQAVARSVTVGAGELVLETVQLSRSIANVPPPIEPLPRPVAVTGPPPEAPSRPSEAPTAAATVTSSPAPAVGAPSAGGAGLRTAGIVLGAAGVTAVAVGVVFGIKAHSAGEDASKSKVYDPGADDTGKRYQTLQYVGYGVGAALVAAGVTTFVIGVKRDGEADRPRVSLSPLGNGGALFALGGSF